MKEVLTKKFWRDMKKIFDEARAETPAGVGPEAGPKGEVKPGPGPGAEAQPPEEQTKG